MFGLWGSSRYYRVRSRALPDAARLAARDAILDSPFMSTNNLNARFTGTYGFSVTFRVDGLDEVCERFGSFKPFLELALDRRCNAFFLNPLLISDGASVAPHIDLSLQTYCPAVLPPRRVAVWYISVPPALSGGALRLYRGTRLVAEIAPSEGALLLFKGDLRHAVAEVTAGAPSIYEARLSLVLEQYRVPDADLAGVPRCLVGSRRAAAGASPPLAGGVGAGEFGRALHAAFEDPERTP